MIQAEEIAATIPVPRSYIDDAAFNMWGEIRPRLAEAVAKTIDNAIISGVGAPASFPAGGVMAMGNPPVQAMASPDQPDLAQAISFAMTRIENTGLDVSGFAARSRCGATSEPCARPRAVVGVGAHQTGGAGLDVRLAAGLLEDRLHPAGAADLIAGDWSYLIIGMREDMRFDMSEHGVLTRARHAPSPCPPSSRTWCSSAFTCASGARWADR